MLAVKKRKEGNGFIVLVNLNNILFIKLFEFFVEGVAAILFIVSLSCYNQVMEEDAKRVRKLK